MSRPRLAVGAQPTAEQIAALLQWRADMGTSWRSKLLAAWESGGRGYSSYTPALQQLRNNFGPTWLTRYKIPASTAELNGCAALRAPAISGQAFADPRRLQFNTGRFYQPTGHKHAGQVINVEMIGSMIYFDDLSRGIDGHFEVKRPEFLASDSSLQDCVMRHYDVNDYRPGKPARAAAPVEEVEVDLPTAPTALEILKRIEINARTALASAIDNPAKAGLIVSNVQNWPGIVEAREYFARGLIT